MGIEDEEWFRFVEEDTIIKKNDFLENFVGFLKIDKKISNWDNLSIYIKENYQFANLEEILNLLNNISYFRNQTIIKSYSLNSFLDSIESKLQKYALKNKDLSSKSLQYQKLKKVIKKFDVDLISFY